MKNAMQLKAIIKNIAKEKNVPPQIILQNYMFERFLERLSLSSYQSNFILKGGLLIASMIGVDSRVTMDMDATIRGLPMNSEIINEIFQKICLIKINDGVNFTIKGIEEIRESSNYKGLRISLIANCPPMKVPLKIDITSGDEITPKEIIYDFTLLMEPRKIKIMAYNLETILAEKLETIISRGNQNTRPRDYYDVYKIRQLQWENINTNLLKKAFLSTVKNRNTESIIKKYPKILLSIKESKDMNSYWINYQNQYDYAKDILFEDTCSIIDDILDDIFNNN